MIEQFPIDSAGFTEDERWMLRAVAVGSQGTRAVRPNPLVGCVLVRDDQEIASGFHAQSGHAHAEVAALTAAGPKARGATAYVTLEPCSHQGRTGPCTQALISAGISRVVYGASDPNPLAQGGAEVLRRAGLAVCGGVALQACRRLAEVFLTNQEQSRSFIQLKLAMTLDGRIAARDGTSQWITSESARLQVHAMRANSDAILVGSGTALADDPQLSVRNIPNFTGKQPIRLLLDRRLRLPADALLARTEQQATWVLTTQAQLASAQAEKLAKQGVQLIALPPDGSLKQVLADLYQRGLCHILVEGGATVAAALLREDLVDRLDLMIAPKILGDGPMAFAPMGIDTIARAQQWHFAQAQPLAPDLWTILYRSRDVHRPD